MSPSRVVRDCKGFAFYWKMSISASTTVAILKFRHLKKFNPSVPTSSSIEPYSVSDFEVLLVKEGDQKRTAEFRLPSCPRRRRSDDECEQAIRLARRCFSAENCRRRQRHRTTNCELATPSVLCHRAVQVSYWKGSIDYGFRQFHPLYCVPILGHGE